MPEFCGSTTVGDHVPVIPFTDEAGNVGTDPPAQIVLVVPKLNVGTTLGLTATVNVAVVAHKPVVGVNMYVPPVWLLTVAGLHIPEIPLVELFGSAGTVPPAQILNAAPKLNVGIMLGLTVTVKVVGDAHRPAVGVNVYVPDV